MKSLLTLAFLALFTFSSAQYNLPAQSPRETITQQFSLSSITVDYGRPAMKGRKIFGELVPYGQVWRLGANSSTKITFKEKVNFGGKPVNPGTYGVFALVGEKEWQIILSKDSQSWGTQYDESLDLVRVPAAAKNLSTPVEWFTIDLTPKSETELMISFSWDRTLVEMPISVQSAEATGKIKEKLMEIRSIERGASK